jgi:pimeloyl-ACP methyl ester carboxylesterase
MKFWRIYLLPVLVIAMTGCSKNKGTDENLDMGNFVSASAAGNYSSLQLRIIAAAQGYGDAADYLKYEVNFIRLVYKTNYKGAEIEASGLLAIPKNVPGKPSIISAQHGTVFLKDGGPSGFPSENSASGYELLASTGFITVIPDYIGYNVSKQITHPYYHMGYSGAAVTDMLNAATKYLKREKIAFSERLFLLGYSEGGYVTMAAQKAIEAGAVPGLSLKAAAAGAGGYDQRSLLDEMSSADTYGNPAYLAMLLNAYNVTLGWNRPFTDFFKAPYAGKMGDLLDGSKSEGAINAQLTTSLTGLLNTYFYTGLGDSDGEKTLKMALMSNSFIDWFPRSPTRLYHGTADEVVPIENSMFTISRFKQSHAPDAALIPIPGGTHESSALPMVLNVLPWFQSLDK